ncbi:MAG: lipoyl(octanoyl) transferase LipB [Rugosibacter sp.]|nr:lipoyl(octanoyl) transferase LipB [Rugosibacter sp.]
MQELTAARTPDTPDEIWLCEHLPVFTQGLSGKAEHLLQDIGIPVVQIDRGGQITYHGPGQVVAYLLFDLRRQQLKVREFVRRMEQAVIDVLASYGIDAARLAGAPGVYVQGAKIAALGLRIKGGCSYHGIALNVDVDLAPYQAINPCGYAGMRVTRLCDLVKTGDTPSLALVGTALAQALIQQLETS